MESLKELIMTVCVLSSGICIVEGLTEGTRFKTQMKFLLNLIFVSVLISSFVKGGIDIDLPELESRITGEYTQSQELYTEELKKQTEANISEVLKQQIEASGIKCHEIETKVNISETNSISISSVTVSTDDYEAAAEIIRSSLGKETEVYNNGV